MLRFQRQDQLGPRYIFRRGTKGRMRLRSVAVDKGFVWFFEDVPGTAKFAEFLGAENLVRTVFYHTTSSFLGRGYHTNSIVVARLPFLSPTRFHPPGPPGTPLDIYSFCFAVRLRQLSLSMPVFALIRGGKRNFSDCQNLWRTCVPATADKGDTARMY